MASINDVAKKAGVSKSTVSLVINKNGYVSQATREKVESAIKELNYIPSKLAQNFSKQHSGQIAVVVPDIQHPYFSGIVKELEKQLAQYGYMTILCSAKDGEHIEKWYIELLNRKIVDGIIMAGHTIDLEPYKQSARPIVSIDRFIDESVPVVHADHKQAAEIASELIISAGCRDVTQFVGTKNIFVISDSFNVECERLLKNAGINVNSVCVGHNTFELSEYDISAEELYEKYPHTDCIIGVDLSIIICMKKAKERNISVPENLKMIAYDGTYVTRLGAETITAVKQPIEEMAKCAAKVIMKLIKEEKLDKMEYIFPVSLQKGDTL